MKIIREPTIYLTGHQSVQKTEIDRFLADHGTTWETDTERGGELLSEMAGRVCYVSFGARQGRRSNRDYIHNILEMQHGSVLEHAVWNFIITGVSRSFTHELVRHRAGFGYSQLSQRYVDESTADYIEPDIIADDPAAHELWLKAIQTTHRTYMELVERLNLLIDGQYPEMNKTNKRKAARQAARSVLPNATETKIFVTANARALRHFVELRGTPFAEPEIRKVAVAMLRILQEESPNIFGDYEIYSLEDGTLGARTAHHKV